MANPVITINPTARDFSDEFTTSVSISERQPGDRFYYTTDGTDPSTSTSPYFVGDEGTFVVPTGQNYTLKVIAVRLSPAYTSAIQSVTYTYVDANAAPFFETLQVANLGSFPSGSDVAVKIQAHDDGRPSNSLMYSIVAGDIPDGLTLDADTGVISGSSIEEDTHNFTVQVADLGGLTATKAFQMTISPVVYALPLSAPFTSVPESVLNDLVRLSFRVLGLVDPTRARVMISWNNFGLADYVNTVVHQLDITESGITLPGFPKIFSNEEAFENSYRVILDEWDLTKQHNVEITINGFFKRQLNVAAMPTAAPTEASMEDFDTSKNKVSIVNTRGGIKISLKSCQYDLDSVLKNVFIYRADGVVHSTMFMPLVAVMSVPVSVVIPTTVNDYSFVTKGGIKNNSPVQSDIDGIMTKRSGVCLRLSKIDNVDNFLEETNQDIISTYDPGKIKDIKSITSLDPLVYNQKRVLYHDVETDKYYWYRDKVSLYRPQAPVDQTSEVTKWLEYENVSRTKNTTFVINVPGYMTNDATSYDITGAVRASNGDYTSFTTSVSNTGLVNSIKEIEYPNTKFMTHATEHYDIDVEDGQWYTYKVEVELLNGLKVTLSNVVIQKEVPKRNLIVASAVLEDLTTPLLVEDSLTEYDFQSGTQTNTSGSVSVSKEDYQAFLLNQQLERDCGCDLECC
jgi:hypothetical protein